MRTIREIWAELGRFSSASSKPLRLRRPAREAAVRAAEKTIGIDFPSDFRESLLLHDGQEVDDEGETFAWLPGHANLAPLDALVGEWSRGCRTYEEFYGDGADPAQPIERERLFHWFWHPRRIPIAGNRHFDQDNTYLDFFPGPKGTPGQLAIFGKGVYGAWHGPSFGAALDLFVRGLERGEWVVRDGEATPRAKRMSWLKYVATHLG